MKQLPETLRSIAAEMDGAAKDVSWVSSDGTNVADLLRSAADEIERSQDFEKKVTVLASGCAFVRAS